MSTPVEPLPARGLTLAIAVLWASVCGADEPAGPYQLPPVVISASRLGEEMSAATRDVLIVDATQIARRGPASITELLGWLPGVDTRRRGPLGIDADLEMDGSTFGQVLLLVDGIRVNNPQTGHHNLNLPLSPDDLERVEVLYGGGSAVHGPDALGGVINLVTRSQVPRRVRVRGDGGGNIDDGGTGAATDIDVRHGWRGSRGAVWLSGGKAWSNGYRDGTEHDEERGYVRALLPVAGGDLSVHAGVQDKTFGARDFYWTPSFSREWTLSQMAGANYRRGDDGRSVVVRSYIRRHRDRFANHRDDPDSNHNLTRSLLLGTEGYGSLAAGGGRIVIGGELSRESIESSSLGDHGRNRFGVFGEYGRRHGRWHLTSGVRSDHHEGSGWEASPSVSVARSHAWGRLYASVARSYRVPSYTEIYLVTSQNVGNPDLGAERAWQLEGGGDAALLGARVSGALFARRETDLVDYVRNPGEEKWRAQNLGEMETVGVRLRARRRFRHASVDAGYTWVDKEQTLAEGFDSKYAFTHPRQQLSAGLDHELPAQVQARWQLTWRERLAPLTDYLLVDLVLSRPLPFGRVLLRARNLTDRDYTEIFAPMPGRWFGVETQMDF